jgi:hypothetical protein
LVVVLAAITRAGRPLGLRDDQVIPLRAPTLLVNIPTQKFRHILSALVFAAQSPYPGRQIFLITAQAVPIQPERQIPLVLKLFGI